MYYSFVYTDGTITALLFFNMCSINKDYSTKNLRRRPAAQLFWSVCLRPLGIKSISRSKEAVPSAQLFLELVRFAVAEPKSSSLFAPRLL